MAEPGRRRRLAVDVGGTFIDYVLLDEATGEVLVEKQPATAGDLMNEFTTGITRLTAPLSETELLIHGTPVAVNARVQLRGAKTGLLTTTGFAGSRSRDWPYPPPTANADAHRVALGTGRPGRLFLRSAVPAPWKNMELTEDTK
jgi:hypothetical protein